MAEIIRVEIHGDAAQFTRTTEIVVSAIKRAENSVNRFNRHSVSGTQAASAAIRLLEGDITNMVRAAENFVGRSKILTNALKTAFPVIGAVAIGAVIAEGTEKLVKFIEKANQVPNALRNAFESSNLSITTTNDELTRTNDMLRNQIALLEHKPVNSAQIAIDDARIAADKLAKSLTEDNKQLQQLLKNNSIGLAAGVVTGQGATSATAGLVKYWSNELQQRSNAVVIAQHQYGVNSPEAKAAQANLTQRQKDAENSVSQQLTQLKQPRVDISPWGDPFLGGSVSKQINNTGNIAIAQGYLAQLYGRDNEASLQSQNTHLQGVKQRLETSKEAATQAKAAQEKLIQNWQQGLDRAKALYNYSANDEANYWLTMADHAKAGSVAYVKALDNANRLIAQQQKELGTNRDKWTAAQLSPSQQFTDSTGQPRSGAYNWGSSLRPDSTVSSQGKATAQWLKNLSRGTDIQRANADALKEQSLQMDIAAGRVSRLDAAQRQAALHTEEYTQALGDLLDKRKQIANASWLSPAEKSAQTSGIENQIAMLKGKRSLQVTQDSAAIQSATALGSLRDAAAQLSMQFSDFAGNISSLAAGAVVGMNGSMSSALLAKYHTGQERKWGIENALGGQMRSVAGQGLTMGMGMIESPLLSRFGLGKKHHPAGSSSDPIYTRSADAQNFTGLPGVSSVLSGNADPLGLVPPSVNISGMASSLMSLIPGFANGGTTPSNMPFLVGENGPELMSLPYSTHITPNHKLSSLGGSITNHIAVDARGATDPAAVKAMVYEGIRQAAPHIVKAAHASSVDIRRRTPASAKK